MKDPVASESSRHDIPSVESECIRGRKLLHLHLCLSIRYLVLCKG